MVGFKENIIKLTDYPFTYSVLGSLFVIFFKKNISLVNTPFNEYIPVLIFIGIIGTIISIIDPFGRLAKLIIIIVANYKYALKTRYNSSQPVILERKFQHLYEFFIKRFGLSEMVEEKREKKKRKERKEVQWYNILRVISTSWINYEIDKLVSAFYFIIVLVFLIYIIENPVHYHTYIQFVTINLNSTNTNENATTTNTNENATTTDTNENATTTDTNCAIIVKDSKQTNNPMALYCDLRIPVFTGFLISLILLVVVFGYSCYTLSNKIETLNDYYEVTEEIDHNVYQDTVRSELDNLDKYFLDSLNTHDWGLAREFLNRIQTVSKRKDDSRINASV